MRRYGDGDEVGNLVIVGAGAGGGSVLAQRLARQGADRDATRPGRSGTRTRTGGPTRPARTTSTGPRSGSSAESNPIELGKNNSGRGVGGSTATTPATRRGSTPLDFATKSRDGVGWTGRSPMRPPPALRAGGAGAAGGRPGLAVGHPHRYPHSPHPVSRAAEVLREGARRRGIEMRVGPVGIVNGTFGNRPHCIYRGYCLQGCKVNAKASPYVTHLPDALDARCRDPGELHGAADRGRRCHRPRARGGLRRQPEGPRRLQRARFVAVAGYSIETPRLLLASTSRRFPKGIGNDEDQVGRYVMVQGAAQTAGRWPQELRMYKAPPPRSLLGAVLRDRPGPRASPGASRSRPSRRCRSAGPSTCSPTGTGAGRCASTRDTTTGPTIGVLNELLPHPDNRVTLAARDGPVRSTGGAHGLQRSARTTRPTWRGRCR